MTDDDHDTIDDIRCHHRGVDLLIDDVMLMIDDVVLGIDASLDAPAECLDAAPATKDVAPTSLHLSTTSFESTEAFPDRSDTRRDGGVATYVISSVQGDGRRDVCEVREAFLEAAEQFDVASARPGTGRLVSFSSKSARWATPSNRPKSNCVRGSHARKRQTAGTMCQLFAPRMPCYYGPVLLARFNEREMRFYG